MRAWSAPDVPALGRRAPEVQVHDSATGGLVELVPPSGVARMYVCGITPYDATHMGHAATYVAFDLLNRAWRSAGHAVRYVQNVTDVDDPLLERANATGEDWVALAERETELFRTDMEALRVLPPKAYVGAVEAIPLVVDMIGDLQKSGAVYGVPNEDGSEDLYFSVHADPTFGSVSGWDREQMMTIFAERGGDPDRPGKRDPLDCLLWQAERPNDPAWDSALGRGRPGWHIECSAIARDHLGGGFEVQGGGSDLVFPHHEMSAAESQVAEPDVRFARAYVHAGMVALDGEKMSKSKGNLELVSRLRENGTDPMAIRLALLAHHYRSDWEWTEAGLQTAVATLEKLREAVASGAGAATEPVVEGVLTCLATDLDAPGALIALDSWATATLAGDTSEPGAGAVVRTLADAALGLRL
ncbi:cysteine--1-D-myo-inosityl 2-amino-2-deoxy-alpha-D-glucopyranoside ligase [Nocardioides marmorisolisilvae]|uniref:L-cysteine:1D-myo-inositol 2-amino-2-deoxy-alpha-D-glucopyranoside ligase n=1 Tax=Nocardioides marmorisolisilvae TaxID=1542737 RepID=A0A3N0DUR2_9ACTN|nr:cysteine--1-D-myo-inosityl 2-amino-2-deoxy-alpha-D-glucopyranoside ligase [Nocardioides marmorisolisilvae]RNL79365.1 cysteine--1-D-myo-inosityl 2-amino-2-deoxy-alpha-D-glucopyranoside ligase [Nocardioides marmorisolisilvae]